MFGSTGGNDDRQLHIGGNQIGKGRGNIGNTAPFGFQAPEVATLGPSVASDIFTVGRTLMVLSAEVPGYQGEYEFRIPPAEELPAIAAHDSLYRLLLRADEVLR